MPYTSKRKAASSGDSRKRAAVSTGDDDDDDKNNENQIFDLGKNKKVRVSKFKGSLLVDIREYYTGANQESLPGRKGISLNSDTWKKLLDLQAQINEAIASVDPTAGKALLSKETVDDDDDDDEKEEESKPSADSPDEND